ncbi:Transmembrane domain-containing protein [Cedratvirus Zaza IHUMI]|uniref:Transmembrane domain-containing protein n=1 Tax=Cedratvirus Zaza IHUMI TaxID=2126979 RepID=A0A2R8FFW0_9VIRU|nr:hypothetical protein Cbor_555 [Cedratvirus borely]WIL03641.1 hypothetical protein Cplu_555 [Cedratvirus plubellavi]SPN79895.1 Transmembrane domain-containing protein [Cedratvirus Zaza IHUMI]
MSEQHFGLTFCELLAILVVFVLSRVVAEPWILAIRNAYFNGLEKDMDCTWDTVIYAGVITLSVVFVLLVLDFFTLVPGGTKKVFI